jgi:peptide/nickel transport system ATP-binding protein
MEPLLQVQHLTISFKTENSVVEAVKDLNFSLNRSEILAIVGESGSGKSVTSFSFLQLLAKTAVINGEILFSADGKSIQDLKNIQGKDLQSVRGKSIAIIFQEPMTSLNPVVKCGHQIMEALKAHKNISNEEAKKQAIHWISQVKLPDPAITFEKYPHELSGGQKQRIVIAMAMCCEPSLLICDEPTTALDVTVQKSILELIKELQVQSKMGVIFITHDLGVVQDIASRALVLFKGVLVEQGSIQEIFTNAKHPYTKALLACRPSNHDKGIRLPVVSDFLDPESKRKVSEPVHRTEIKNSSTVLKVNNVSIEFPTKRNLLGKTIKSFKAVNNVSFDIKEGETLGIVGESGSGKTTLGRAMLRIIEPSEGSIEYRGKNIQTFNATELQALRKDIQLIFQDPYSSLNPKITIGNAIMEPMIVHRLYENNKQRKEKVIELLHKVNLSEEHFNRYPHEFSGGQRQRIVIARALALNPRFLVCDESVSALDVSVQAQVLNLLNDLKAALGLTIVFISHDLSVVKYFCDRMLVLHKGELIEMGDAEQIYHSPKEPYTQSLLNSIPGRASLAIAKG